jgi:hypothetical protein
MVAKWKLPGVEKGWEVSKRITVDIKMSDMRAS